MRSFGVVVLVLVAAVGCGGSDSSKTAGGATGGGGSGGVPPGATLFTLEIQSTGPGAVMAAGLPAGCHSRCSMKWSEGSLIQLAVSPDAGAQFDGWHGACSGTSTCVLTLAGDAQVTANFSMKPPPTARITVSPVGSGTGRVTSSPPGIDCPKKCSMDVLVGTTVSIVPTPDASSGFRGFGGACSGTQPCAVTAGEKRTVWVDFALLRKLSVSVANGDPAAKTAGGLSVTSAPEGLTCAAATCTGMFMEGNPIVLSAMPVGGSTFTGWSGACIGTADCTLTLTADTTLVATYKPPLPDDCLGVMPAMLGTPVERSLPSGGHSYCAGAVSDQKGNVAVGRTGNGWTLWSADGTTKGSLQAGPLFPQATGFQGVNSSTTLSDALFVWAPDGSVVRRTELPPYDPRGEYDAGFPAVTGGSVVVAMRCSMPFPFPAEAKADFFVSRFDEAGTLVSRSLNIGGGGSGCAGYVFALSDALDRTLVLAMGLYSRAARWLDRNGTPLTDWFDPGSAFTDGPYAKLRPLIGGGVIIPGLGAEHRWVLFPSGQAKVEVPAKFIYDGHDVLIVRSGKAYGVYDAAGSLALYSPAGNRCGTVPVPQGADLHVGADGTMISLSGPGSCNIAWWSALLK